MSGVKGMRRGRGLPDGELEPCGTLAAYRRHLRRGDRVDRDCREANSRAWQDRAAAGYVRPSRRPPDPLGDLFRELLGLIAAECRRAGMLPETWRPGRPGRRSRAA